jgi:hypothetical protein
MNSNKLLLEEVQKFITHVAGLPICDNKIKIMDTLLDLEWNLREKENLVEEMFDKREEPWSE